MEQVSDKYTPLFAALKKESSVLFVNEDAKAPAKLIKAFRDKDSKPALKAAFVEDTVFLGESSLEDLLTLKTKNEMLGEIIGLLQSPIKNVLSGLTGSGQKIAGILKTLSEKES